MYNKSVIDELVEEVQNCEGIGNKEKVAAVLEELFGLEKMGAVYYGEDFAIRFASTKSNTDSVSNTVMALKHVKLHDDIPIFVCVVGPERNYLRLANATFLKKVSHSSKNLRVDNIVGNINYSDIMKEYNGIENGPGNFETLFREHSAKGFEGNIARLVEETSNIVPTGKRYVPTAEEEGIILEAPQRTYDFICSFAYNELKRELDNKTNAAKADIDLVLRSYGHDVKSRGNLIEYFITSDDEKKKEELRNKIRNNEVVEDVKVDNDLGDYSAVVRGFKIEVDIKSKVDTLSSAPKGYNIDKLLEFLSSPASVYMLYVVLINANEDPKTHLVSIFQKQVLDKTHVQHHWAGRSRRGTGQFDGRSLEYFINDPGLFIEIEKSRSFLKGLIDLDDEREK